MLLAGSLSFQHIAAEGKRAQRCQSQCSTAAKDHQSEFQGSGERGDYSALSTKFLNDSICLRVSFLNAPGIRNAMIFM